MGILPAGFILEISIRLLIIHLEDGRWWLDVFYIRRIVTTLIPKSEGGILPILRRRDETMFHWIPMDVIDVIY